MPNVTDTDLVRNVLVDVSITELSGTQRRVDIVWRTDTGQSFIAPGTVLNGQPITRMTVAFGDVFGLADPSFNNPFGDPLYAGIESSVGTLFDSTGGVVLSGEFFTADVPGGWRGGVLFTFRSSAGDELDITTRDYARYEATVIYNLIPTPGTGTLLLAGGLLAARRRRA
ncbi:MAG: hypothetical protein EA378_01725 [Phycisphaerales bacterium]|nr:MAG: hypothetical protein EA378_01725 [Phycisphaerales bacterium]